MHWHGKIIFTVVTVTVAILTALVACGGAPVPDEEQIETLIQKNLEANEKDDSRALYELYAPSNRDACPFDRFVKAAGIDTGISDILDPLGSDVTYSDLEIEITGDSALASFVLQVDTTDVPLSDLSFVKEGKWFFDMSPDTLTACGD